MSTNDKLCCLMCADSMDTDHVITTRCLIGRNISRDTLHLRTRMFSVLCVVIDPWGLWTPAVYVCGILVWEDWRVVWADARRVCGGGVCCVADCVSKLKSVSATANNSVSDVNS